MITRRSDIGGAGSTIAVVLSMDDADLAARVRMMLLARPGIQILDAVDGRMPNYAFAVAVSGVGVVIGHVIRTVLFPEVFRLARRAGADASSDYLDQAMLPFAWVFPPAFGLAALALGPAIELILPSYTAAAPAARIFIFIGVVQGLAMVANLGIVASGRQHLYLGLRARLSWSICFCRSACSRSGSD